MCRKYGHDEQVCKAKNQTEDTRPTKKTSGKMDEVAAEQVIQTTDKEARQKTGKSKGATMKQENK